ncbi:hypothetical protein AOQ84DRAFT_221215 [Glonium stellatum]|uniref:Uncharacterized protein n=1 Tax=Glonium stellatum TaxID=574774 RepID=A0A8E2F1Z1_9PEZI|nr:hypothetical protein AOQ84DRAFT_221215 [Glonium stellatum]
MCACPVYDLLLLTGSLLRSRWLAACLLACLLACVSACVRAVPVGNAAPDPSAADAPTGRATHRGGNNGNCWAQGRSPPAPHRLSPGPMLASPTAKWEADPRLAIERRKAVAVAVIARSLAALTPGAVCRCVAVSLRRLRRCVVVVSSVVVATARIMPIPPSARCSALLLLHSSALLCTPLHFSAIMGWLCWCAKTACGPPVSGLLLRVRGTFQTLPQKHHPRALSLALLTTLPYPACLPAHPLPAVHHPAHA